MSTAPRWKPTPIWDGMPCYIIGGGPSLEGFPFQILAGRNAIGCNVAFYLGVDIVPITIFGDTHFFKQHQDGLTKYALNPTPKNCRSMASRLLSSSAR